MLLDLAEGILLPAPPSSLLLVLCACVILARLVPAAQTRLHLLFHTLINLVMLVMIIQTRGKVGVLLEVVVLFNLLLDHILGVMVAVIDHTVRQNDDGSDAIRRLFPNGPHF